MFGLVDMLLCFLHKKNIASIQLVRLPLHTTLKLTEWGEHIHASENNHTNVRMNAHTHTHTHEQTHARTYRQIEPEQ